MTSNEEGSTADSPGTDDPSSNPDTDSTAPSTILVEVLPGAAMVFGEVPKELRLDLIDFGLVSAADRTQISTVLASIGTTAAVAGNVGNAFASAQGLYRISSTTQALLRGGGALAVKDGANLGAVFANGKIIGQARFIPVATVGAAQTVAALGPALAMIALQMQLSTITGLVRTNIALTSQVLTTIRSGQWAELTALVTTVDQTVDQARKLESVPTSLWDTVAGKRADLRTQLDLYRMNVGSHVRQIHRVDPRGRREYLETNAEAILFDANALLASLKAWIGYQALHAARARTAGPEDTAEAALVDIIAQDTRKELDSALAESTRLIDSLTRELRIIVELPGRATLPLTGKRKDSKAARHTSALLLEAIEPLADALHPPVAPLTAPDVVCAPRSLDLGPYLRILRWLLEDGETLRVLGFTDQPDALDPVSAIFSGARDKLAAARDKAATKTLVAVTDRRIITAKASTFLEQGETRQDIPIELIRYVRVPAAQDKATRSVIDLITRDENIRWLFSTDIDSTDVDALAAVLAESMTIPDVEREKLQRRHHIPIGPAKDRPTVGVSASGAG
ncbi:MULTISPECIES: hypothetical protein [Micromonospora]|uniref:Uncharacterized protein n=1 Tax=Micromonospora yangpuensis TaxID=683228 RepID=A0A1C6V2R5_9ACTN|nr:hypothetical protein [Micromonospora yangpuensis]GGM32467.1 hypothetical protein GCM10012279_59270 [Micromonospora yangpuensis]SCL60586.1 hypothetical protein GA0070617_4421 [Micromonospora yangpuensis]